MNMIRCFFSLALIALFGHTQLIAQAPLPSRSASEIQHSLRKLQVLGSVLYVAAHPDDENTRLLAYLAGEKGYRTAYLSLTRGDGGQNSLGDEKGPHLGILRTQELLAARRIDGAEQMFSRAYDFGYSKTPKETLEIWDKEKVLGDVVWAIRKFRPDVIITRFPTMEKGGGGHGHHTSSAILAKEAFHLAADPKAYPEQLEYVSTWQPKRLLWNMFFWRRAQHEIDYSDTISVNIGAYNPLLGKSYGEIAAEARSMHKCQDFGASRQRGALKEFLQHELGEKANSDLFEGISTGWDRVGEPNIDKMLQKAFDEFNPADPSASVPQLMKALREMEERGGYWFELKSKELKEAIIYCSGLWFEVSSKRPLVATGDSVHLTAQVIKRSAYPVRLERIDFGYQDQVTIVNADINHENKLANYKKGFVIQNQTPGQHYWLANPMSKGLFNVQDQSLTGLPENPPSLNTKWTFTIDKTTFSYQIPVVHKYVDRKVGELYRPFIIAPPVTINIAESVYLFSEQKQREVKLQVKTFLPDNHATLYFEVPEGWEVDPAELALDFAGNGSEKSISVTVTPPSFQSVGNLKVIATVNEFQGSFSTATIDYNHIPTQMVFDPAETRLVKIELKKEGSRIGYIMGSEEETPACLEQIGYQVDLLGDDKIITSHLNQYDAVIAGSRAFYTRKRMPYHTPQILEYVKQGGTYIVQYNKTYDARNQEPGPYPIKISRDRVTNEDSPVKFLNPEHPVLNYPNKITKADFEGWIQERGLYFPNEWDERYEPILGFTDPGEEQVNGSLLVARYGEGHFVYTGISWFRELPAGVPGAYRLFTNMISLGKDER